MCIVKSDNKHLFFYLGNPFKIDKRMMVDEADIDIVGSASSNSKGLKRSLSMNDINSGNSVNRILPTKRKAGPIPKDFPVPKIARRFSFSASNSPCHSPLPWTNDEANKQINSRNLTNITPVTCSNNSSLPAMLPPTLNVASTGNHSNLVKNIAPDKLINGLNSEVTLLQSNSIFETKSVDFANNHVDMLNKPFISVNNIYANKSITKVEKTEIDRIECNKVPQSNVNYSSDVQKDNGSVVKIKCQINDNELYSNHVEEKREVKNMN